MKKYKILILCLGLALTACSKQEAKVDKPEPISDEEKTETSSMDKEDKNNDDESVGESTEENPKNMDMTSESEIAKRNPLKGHPVKGAVAGSNSTLVEDREVWKDFVIDRQMERAQSPFFGIHIPKILLESKDAKACNEEIEKDLENLKSMYKDAEEYTKNQDDPFVRATFSTYQDEDILSVLVHMYNSMDYGFQEYKAYNFSIKDGKRLTDEELLSYFGVKTYERIDLMEDSVATYYRHIIELYDSDFSNPSYEYDLGNKEGFTIRNLWLATSDEFYINEVGKPMFLAYVYSDFGFGPYTQPMELAGKDYKANQYSDEFLRMAAELGVDPDDEEVKAFIIYMGKANAEDSLPNVISKLSAWQGIFGNYKDPRLILAAQRDSYDERPYLTGDDYYLIVPKWDKAVVSLRSVEMGNDGQIQEKENECLDNICQRSTVLLCQKQEGDTANVKIRLAYRNNEVETMLSLDQNGEIKDLGKDFIDASKIIDWDKAVQEYSYSTTIYDKVLSIMGRG